jgi:hypothetical protein
MSRPPPSPTIAEPTLALGHGSTWREANTMTIRPMPTRSQPELRAIARPIGSTRKGLLRSRAALSSVGVAVELNTGGRPALAGVEEPDVSVLRYPPAMVPPIRRRDASVT